MVSRPVLTAVGLSSLAILLLVGLGLPPGHSVMFNYAWAAQYSDALSWMNPLPRYLPGLWAGFGGHDFFFYAPLPFWFVAAVTDPLCIGCRASTVFVLGSAIFLVASGFAMFAFLRSFFSARAAAFGAVVFVVLPYHLLVDWFERQAAGEFAAYAFIPLVALGIERIRRGAGGGGVLAIGVAGTALSHLPTTLLAAHVFGAVVLVLIVLESGGAGARLRLFARLAGFGLLGLALASFYWLPAVMLLDTVSPAVLFDPYFEAWRWLYGGAAPQPNMVFAAIVVAAFLACAPFLLGSVLKARGPMLAWILVPVVVVVLLNTAVSEPIWRSWIIAKVQFPWRLMTFADFATGIAAAVLAAGATCRIGWWVLSVALMTALIPVAFLAAQVTFTMQGNPAEKRYDAGFGAMEYLSPEMTETLRTRLARPDLDHFDQRQIAATLADMAAEFAETQPPVQILQRGSRSITIAPPPGAAILSLPVQFWFLWAAETASGTPLQLRANPQFGTIDILPPPEGFADTPVHLSLRYHPSEQLGAAVSVLALLVLLGAALLSRKRRAVGP